MNHNKKINKKKFLIWSLNVILFIGVVLSGIAQAGKGAEISSLESQVNDLIDEKHNLSENILIGNTEVGSSEKQEKLGFIEPENVVYIDSVDSFASLLVR